MQEDKKFYQKLSGEKLSNQEVFEAKQNFVGFYDLLLTIDNRINQEKNENKNTVGRDFDQN